MCHNSALESEQIDKCIENGMPTKIIKTLKYTMRRRVAEAAVANGNENDNKPQHITTGHDQPDKDTIAKNNATTTKVVPSSRPFQMKCPFAHGLLSAPITAPPPTSPIVNSSAEPQIANLFEVRQSLSSTNSKSSSTASVGIATGITNLSVHDENMLALQDDGDILAKGTQFTRKLTFHMQQSIGRLQKSKIYTLLTKTTQPAHVLAICILIFVLLTIWPELLDGATSSSTSQQQRVHASEAKNDHHHDAAAKKNHTLALIAYLGAFSTHFGAQIWMTFVSGLSLYFSLPRHMFGQCQQILFPKYFAMNGVLSITMLILFVKYFLNSWTLPQCIQLGALSITGAIEVLVRLYLAPPLLYLMHEKYKIEGTIGSGKEVGSLVQGDLIQCPHYQRIHKAFRRIHMTVAIGNLITMAASCLHLYFIAGQIHISI